MRIIQLLLVLCCLPLAAAHGENLLAVNYEGANLAEDRGDVLSRRDTKRITIIDNTFFGISGMKELRDKFTAAGWDATYREDTFVKELVEAAQNSDVLYIVTHAGVRESDRQVGFVWRSFMGSGRTW